MLEVFRRQSRSILIYVFFGIIIAVFVINFGPQSQGCGGAAAQSGFAARVGSHELSDGAFYFGWFLYNGPNMRPERSRALHLKERIMSKLIERELFAQEAERLGMSVSTREVEEMLEDGRMVVLGVRQNVRSWIFKDDQFDRSQLERFVHYQLNMSLKRFIEEERREMLAERMRDLVRASVKITPDEVERSYDQENTLVNLEFVKFDPQKLPAAELTDADIAAYIKAHKKDIEEYYNSHKSEYTNLKPQARVRHILFALPADAKPEVKAKKEAAAKAALARLEKGADFAATAAKLSDDVDTKDRGGDLGWRQLTALDLGAEGENKVRLTKEGAVVKELLTSPRGFHIVKVEAKRQGDLPLAVVETEIARKLALENQQQTRAKDLAQAALAKVQAGAKLEALFPKETPPASTQPKKVMAAKKSDGPTVQETGLFVRRGNIVSQIGVSPELAKEAFTLTQERPAPARVFDVSGTFVVVRLKERKEPNKAEFEKTRDEVTRRQQLQKWAEIMSDWAQRQCVAARDAGRISVNQELLAYETKTGIESANFQPCSQLN